MKKFPENLLITITHGSYFIPTYLKFFLTKEFKNNNYRLLKNFSDFATRDIIPTKISKNQIIYCNFSRALGDPNRKRTSNDLFREVDFNSIKVWKLKFPLILKKYLLKKYYDKYHNDINSKIKLLEKKHKKIILLDIHDTGNVLLGSKKIEDKKRKEKFPKINLGNCDNKTSSKKTINKLDRLFQKHFKIKPSINKPYKGGYVTQEYGLNQINRDVIQIEFGRYMYLDENTQTIDKEKVEVFKNKLYKLLNEL
jgi:N-formylglutamate amidohydrolase